MEINPKKLSLVTFYDVGTLILNNSADIARVYILRSNKVVFFSEKLCLTFMPRIFIFLKINRILIIVYHFSFNKHKNVFWRFHGKKLIVNFFKKLRYTTFLRMEIQFWNGWWDNKLSFSSFHFLMPLCRASEFWERNLHKKVKCFFHRLDRSKRMEVGIGNQAIIMSWNVGKTIWRGNLIEVQGIVCKKSKIWNWKFVWVPVCFVFYQTIVFDK